MYLSGCAELILPPQCRFTGARRHGHRSHATVSSYLVASNPFYAVAPQKRSSAGCVSSSIRSIRLTKDLKQNVKWTGRRFLKPYRIL